MAWIILQMHYSFRGPEIFFWISLQIHHPLLGWGFDACLVLSEQKRITEMQT